MTSAALSFRQPVLPWAVTAEDERRFRRIASVVLLASLLFGVALPWLPGMAPERKRSDEPPVLARLLVEPAKLAPPPQPQRELPERRIAAKAEVPKAVEPPKTESDKPEGAKPVPKPPPGKMRVKDPVPDQPAVTQARNPQPGKAPGEDLAAVRKRASGVGLLAMKDALADLRSAPLAVQVAQDVRPGPGVGTNTGVGVGMGSEPGLPTRNLITSSATNGSGGINNAPLSRDTGGGGLTGRGTTLVAGVAGGGGGGGAGGGGGGKGGAGGNANGSGHGGGGDGTGGNGTGTGGKGSGGAQQRDGSGKASRSLEEIRIVFERNKGSIYAIYNRALREDPALQGKVLVELKIAPEGNVLAARVVSSELHAQELEGKLLARIRQFDFGAKDVNVMVVSYPVDFLPS